MATIDRLLLDCRAATMTEGGAPYGAIEDAAILIEDGRIAWIGPRGGAADRRPRRRGGDRARSTAAG